MPRAAGTWTETFTVRSYETDPKEQASIQTLCNYFQEAAGNHAQTYGVSIDALLAQDLTWVLSRLQVAVEAYPVRGETVRLETWPAGVEGLFALRDFLLYRPGTPEPVVRGTSAWLVVDVHRKRPVRVPPAITEIVPPDRPRALAASLGRLVPPPGVAPEHRFRVRYSDLDVNQHVNNVRYAEWAVESVPEAVLHACRLRSLMLQFHAETTLGDTILAQAVPAPDGEAGVYMHRLVRASDGRDAALARTVWEG